MVNVDKYTVRPTDPMGKKQTRPKDQPLGDSFCELTREPLGEDLAVGGSLNGGTTHKWRYNPYKWPYK